MCLRMACGPYIESTDVCVCVCVCLCLCLCSSRIIGEMDPEILLMDHTQQAFGVKIDAVSVNCIFLYVFIVFWCYGDSPVGLHCSVNCIVLWRSTVATSAISSCFFAYRERSDELLFNRICQPDDVFRDPRTQEETAWSAPIFGSDRVER